MKKIFGTFVLFALLLAALFIFIFKNKGSDAVPSKTEAEKFHKEQLENAIQLSLEDQAPFQINLNSIIKSKKMELEITKKDSNKNQYFQGIDLYLVDPCEDLLAKNQLIIGITWNKTSEFYIAEINQHITNISLTLARENKQKQIKNTATQNDLGILQTKINECQFKLKDDDGFGLRSESDVLYEYLNTRKPDPSNRK